jgi:hypothetical protein
MRSSTSAANAGSASIGRVSSVSTNVGAIALTRMPCGASSIAAAFTRPSIACLVAQ